MLDRNIADVIILCERFYRENQSGAPNSLRQSDIFSKYSEILESAFVGYSTLQKAVHPGWGVDNDHPGYLFKVVGRCTYRVPYFLVPVFPAESLMNSVWEIAEKIKTSDGSVICISGSSATFLITESINDFDFCEYVNENDPGFRVNALRKIADNSDMMCTSVKFGSFRGGRPFDEANISEALDKLAAQQEEQSSGKMDYVICSREFRICDVSNVIIVCDENSQSQSMQKTFAAQEGVLGASMQIPNQICDPFEIGRYANWLKEQIKLYVGKGDHPKALKRAISLSRLCFLSEITDRIQDLCKKSTFLQEKELNEIRDLVERLKTMDEFVPNAWYDELKLSEEIKALEINRRKLASKDREIDVVAEILDIVSDIYELFDGNATVSS